MSNRTIFIVRHGTTEWIEQGIVHGSSVSPLSAYGKEEAVLTAEALSGRKISKIYSSPQPRAMQSAEPLRSIDPSIPLVELDGLRELHFGKMEGTPDLFKRTQGKKLLFLLIGPIWFTILGLTGEKFSGFEKRVLDAWHSILKDEEAGNIAIYSHAIVINTIVNDIFCTSGNKKNKRFKLGTCGITEIEFNGNGQPTVLKLNDTSHLETLRKSKND